MAEIDPWDVHLEALTASLVAGAEGKGAPAGVVTDTGWRLLCAADRRAVTLELHAPDPAAPGLDDYELVLVFGLSYAAPKPWPALPTFRKTLSIREEYRWEEEMLREVVLEMLGLARHVLHATDLTPIPDAAFAPTPRKRANLALRRRK